MGHIHLWQWRYTDDFGKRARSLLSHRTSPGWNPGLTSVKSRRNWNRARSIPASRRLQWMSEPNRRLWSLAPLRSSKLRHQQGHTYRRARFLPQWTVKFPDTRDRLEKMQQFIFLHGLSEPNLLPFSSLARVEWKNARTAAHTTVQNNKNDKN